MNYETFKASIVTSIQNYFGETANVSLHPILRNNNVLLDGLTIQDCSVNISPTIYLNYYYEDFLSGKPLAAILDDIIASYSEHLPKQDLDLSFFTDFTQIRHLIIYKLINYEQNQELLKDLPHFRFLDLAVVFCCFLSDTPHGAATILIQKQHLALWSISADALYELAKKNTPILLPYQLKRMEDIVKAICPDFAGVPKNAPAMYLLTNTEKLYGASAMLYPDILSQFADSIQSDLYLLPSSIHETLILPKNALCRIAEINQMIQDVNQSQVLKEETLSDHAYIFERSSKAIRL